MEQLQQWVKDKCVERNLSWREASIGAGLNPGAISAIVGGQRPGLDSCKALAKFFRVSPILILQLAGHIEESVSLNHPSLTDPHLQFIVSNWHRLPQLNQRRTRELVESLLDLLNKGARDEPSE